MQLPAAFCWTKFGTEAGETTADILQRKEHERERGDGVFFWGIGNSIGPSLTALLELTQSPSVIFTPILSRPRPKDVSPPRVVDWLAGVGLDGEPFEVPRHVKVTSAAPTGRRTCHYALVCRRPASLYDGPPGTLNAAALRNFRTGARVGGSQVTSVVERHDPAHQAGRNYEVAFTATLVYPFLVTLFTVQSG